MLYRSNWNKTKKRGQNWSLESFMYIIISLMAVILIETITKYIYNADLNN